MPNLLPLLIVSLAVSPLLSAQTPAPAQELKIASWTGVTQSGDSAELKLPGEAVFRYPDGARGFYKHGFRTLNDGTKDWQAFYGLRMEVRAEERVELTLTVSGPDANGDGVKSKTVIEGKGWHTVTLPWTAFELPTARRSWLLMVKELRLSANAGQAQSGTMAIRNVKLVRGPAASLESTVRGKSAQPGNVAEYAVTVGNSTDAPQSIALSFVHYGWEAMDTSVEPATVSLRPGESKNVTVRVQVPDRIPPGGHEKQTLQAIANGDAATAATLSFTTASEVPHPSILHTPARWQEVREKVKKYPWAREARTPSSPGPKNGPSRKSPSRRVTIRTTRWSVPVHD